MFRYEIDFSLPLHTRFNRNEFFLMPKLLHSTYILDYSAAQQIENMTRSQKEQYINI